MKQCYQSLKAERMKFHGNIKIVEVKRKKKECGLNHWQKERPLLNQNGENHRFCDANK